MNLDRKSVRQTDDKAAHGPDIQVFPGDFSHMDAILGGAVGTLHPDGRFGQAEDVFRSARLQDADLTGAAEGKIQVKRFGSL